MPTVVAYYSSFERVFRNIHPQMIAHCEEGLARITEEEFKLSYEIKNGGYELFLENGTRWWIPDSLHTRLYLRHWTDPAVKLTPGLESFFGLKK